MSRDDKNAENASKRFDAYISQIEAEDGLLAQRMGWMLQFNGFLFAAYGLALRPDSVSGVATQFLSALPFVGVSVTLMGAIGIWAALGAQSQKRAEWLKWKSELSIEEILSFAARPLFSSSSKYWHASRGGAYGTCLAMLGFWLWILLANVDVSA